MEVDRPFSNDAAFPSETEVTITPKSESSSASFQTPETSSSRRRARRREALKKKRDAGTGGSLAGGPASSPAIQDSASAESSTTPASGGADAEVPPRTKVRRPNPTYAAVAAKVPAVVIQAAEGSLSSENLDAVFKLANEVMLTYVTDDGGFVQVLGSERKDGAMALKPATEGDALELLRVLQGVQWEGLPAILVRRAQAAPKLTPHHSFLAGHTPASAGDVFSQMKKRLPNIPEDHCVLHKAVPKPDGSGVTLILGLSDLWMNALKRVHGKLSVGIMGVFAVKPCDPKHKQTSKATAQGAGAEKRKVPRSRGTKD